MPDTDSFTKASNIIAFIVSFIYRLTVRLAVEFLKFIILLGILVVSCGVSLLGIVSLVVWAYVAYDNSLVAAACAVCLGVVLTVVAALAVEFLVKDVLCLTDKPLLHLAKVYIASSTRNGRREEIKVDNRTPDAGLNSTTITEQQTKKSS